MHIGIILDGNRRFARRLMKVPWKGHEYGAEKVEKLLDWGKELDIKEFTLYALSLENFNRPKKEFDYLISLFKREFSKFLDDSRIDEFKIKIRFIGKKDLFDKDMQSLMNALEKKTKNYSNYVVNFAIGYGGRQEIIEAVNKIVKGRRVVNEETFSKFLWLQDEPDLIIRTGGEKRISNFLLWQGAYSEFIFLSKMWPEFTKSDLKKALKEFSNRKRRFGK